jgi:hypothetical protein
MEDGSALVYEKQGNTGAAAYNQPALRIGATPMDLAAERMRQENVRKEEENLAIAQQKEKEKVAAFKPLMELRLSKFPQANKQELGAKLVAIKNRAAELAQSGVMPNDYTNPKSQEYNQLFTGFTNQLIAADKQGETIDAIQKALLGDFNNPEDKQVFDRDKSIANLQAYINAPNIESRDAIDPNTLLVRKPKEFDTYEPLKDFNISNYVGSFGNPNASGSTLNKAGLKKDMEAVANNPANEEHFKAGVKKGVWNSKAEYAKTLYDKALNQYAADYTLKEPSGSGTTINNLNRGNSGDMLSKMGAGTQKMAIPLYDINGKKVSNTQVNLNDVVQLDDIKSVVNWASAINPETGKSFENNKGTFELVSGAMALPLVRKGSNRILPTDQGSYTFTDVKGKQHTITGDQKSIEKQLIDWGIGEYKPMIFGKTKGDKEELGTDVWLPADAATLGTNDKNKALTKAQEAYYVYKRRAEELNKREAAKPVATKGILD